MPIVPDYTGSKRLAVLIDADNVPRGTLGGIMQEVAIYGTPTVKRIYGDWTGPHIQGWKNSLLENAVTPIQQYSYTTGKNSTDSAMIIDAMDILYTERVDGFVLVSSDSDFTRLAIRLREEGMTVFGIGERKTPAPFIAACDKFIYIENIKQPGDAAAQPAEEEEGPAPDGPGGKAPQKPDTPDRPVGGRPDGKRRGRRLHGGAGHPHHEEKAGLRLPQLRLQVPVRAYQIHRPVRGGLPPDRRPQRKAPLRPGQRGVA